MRGVEVLLHRRFLLVARRMRLAREVDLPHELVDVVTRLLDLQLVVLRGEPRLVDLLGEARDRGALVAELLLLARDVVAQLALDGADAARAHRRDLGPQRLLHRREVGSGERELVRARAERGLDLVARLVRRARGFHVVFEFLHVAPDRIDLRGPLLRGGLRRRELQGEPRRHCDRERAAYRLRERGHGGLQVLAGRQLGELRVPGLERRVEAGGETLPRGPLRRLVVLALQVGAHEVERGLALRRRPLERERRVVAHARERGGRVGEQRVVGDRRPRQSARIALRVDEVLEPERERLFRRELVAARERGGDLHRPSHEQRCGQREPRLGEHVAPERQEAAQPRILEHGEAGVAELGGDDIGCLCAQRLDGGQRRPVGRQRDHAVPPRTETLQELVVQPHDRRALPVALGIVGGRRHQVRARHGAELRECPGQRRRAAAVHAEDDEEVSLHRAMVRQGRRNRSGTSSVRAWWIPCSHRPSSPQQSP